MRSARERLREAREKDKAREKRKRTLRMVGMIAIVLAVAGGVGAAVTRTPTDTGGDGGPVAAPQGASGKDALAITAGSPKAASTLTVYEDFRCPACKSFEDGFRPTVHQLRDSGRLRVDYHLVTLIDGNLGGSGSLDAANAAACAQDAGKFSAYHDVLYAAQPRETDDAFADKARLIKLADRVKGLDTAPFRSCVKNGTHNGWVSASAKAFNKAGFGSTPTVLLNGKNVYADRNDPLTPAKLKKLVASAAVR